MVVFWAGGKTKSVMGPGAKYSCGPLSYSTKFISMTQATNNVINVDVNKLMRYIDTYYNL
jgi:hypothetical protein